MMLQNIKTVNRRPQNASVHRRPPPTDPRKIIESVRLARGFPSVRALALAADVQQPSLSRYLAGKSADLEMATWRALADTLGVTVSQLLGEQPLETDAHVATVLRAMERLPEAERYALAAAAAAMANRKP